MIMIRYRNKIRNSAALIGTVSSLTLFSVSAKGDDRPSSPASMTQPSTQPENITVQGSVIGKATREAVRHYAGGVVLLVSNNCVKVPFALLMMLYSVRRV